MLALTRKKGESLVINNNIEITVLEIRGDQVKIAYWAIFGGFFRAGFTGLVWLLVNLRGPFLAHAENIRTGAGT